MSDRLIVYDVTVPAGTTQTAPQSTALHFDPGYLRRWEVVIPDGPAGLAGFALSYAGVQLAPTNVGAWIVGNDEKVADDLRYDFVGDQWTLLAYNADRWPHTFHLRLFVDEIGATAGPGDAIPEVLPVTINAGSIDLTAGPDTPDLGGEPAPPTFTDTVTPLDIPADQVSIDTGDDVTPLDLPADAPVIIDTPDPGEEEDAG